MTTPARSSGPGPIPASTSTAPGTPGWSPPPSTAPGPPARGPHRPPVVGAGQPGRFRVLSSVAGHHVDAVDHPGNVTQQLQQEGPEHPPGQPLVDEHSQERQEETQNDQENLAHCLTDLSGGVPSPRGTCPGPGQPVRPGESAPGPPSGPPGQKCNYVSMETLFQHAGGTPALRHFGNVFYTSVLADPLLQPLFGAGRPEHVDHLTAFEAESD